MTAPGARHSSRGGGGGLRMSGLRFACACTLVACGAGDVGLESASHTTSAVTTCPVGNHTARATYSIGEPQTTHAVGLALGNGTMVLVGSSSSAEHIWITRRRLSDDSVLWTRSFGSASGLPLMNEALSVAVDSRCNVYVAGFVSAGDAVD